MPRAKAEGEVLETPFVTVFPVEGTYLDGVPTVPTICDEAIAARLVRTGAFRYEAPEIPEGEEAPLIEVAELPASALEVLDFYDPPPPDEAANQPEGPADAGPSDSPEV